LRRLLQNPDVSFDELGRTIELDPGLTANMLRLANSAYFGFQRTIGSIRTAIVRLGTQRVYHLVLGLSVAPLASKPVRGYDLPAGALWQHSVAVAVGAERLGQALKIKFPDYAFTAGMLHDVGKIVLGTFVEADGEAIGKIARQESVSFDVAEQRVLGIDHAEVGAMLLERWNLPSDIVQVGRWHHRPEEFEGDKTVTDLIHVADALCLGAGIGAGADGLHYRPSADAVERLGLTTETSEAVVCEMMEGMNELQGMFGVGAGT
jgi:putative nucleotidyltransferase with HDIG domain